MSEHENLYPKCAIMYSYAVYPQDGAEDLDLIKKVEENFNKIKAG